ncbi:MAG: undecaprenyl-phosphate glucose phosphotransferase [Methylomicrobium sp.]
MQTTGYAREHAALLVFFMRLLDAVLIAGSGVGCFYWLLPIKHFPAFYGWLPPNYATALGVAVLLALWWFPAFNVYRSWRGSGLYAELRPLAAGWLASLVGLVAFIFFTKTANEFSRHWLGLWFLWAFVSMGAARLLLRLVLRQARRRGLNLRHIVLIGDAAKCADIQRRIDAAPWLGLHVVGFFEGRHKSVSFNTVLQKLGDITHLTAFLEQHRVDQVWIALPLREMDLIESLSRDLEKLAVEVLLVPDLSGWRLLNHSVVEVNGLPLINIAVSPMNERNALLKWLEDKMLASLILLLTSPLLLAIALAVKLSSPGPVLYRQERIGWNGKPFYMLKFRSMPVDADTRHGRPVWGGAQAKRPTRVGAFLRKTSLDELPQFINVLKGDMSIVGPRPERPMFVEQFRHEIDGYMQKHLVKAGITGWAQINGWRGDTCLQTRIEHDLYYIQNWSVWLDLKIIVLTLTRGFVSENAY